MILSEQDAIAGMELEYAKIRSITRDYSALRVENYFCSFAPFAASREEMETNLFLKGKTLHAAPPSGYGSG
jgi:hypothetical protein